MRIDCFLDTNILIYAAAAKPDERHKQAIARDIIATQEFVSLGRYWLSSMSMSQSPERLKRRSSHQSLTLGLLGSKVFRFCRLTLIWSGQASSSRGATRSVISTARLSLPPSASARQCFIPKTSITARNTAPSP